MSDAMLDPRDDATLADTMPESDDEAINRLAKLPMLNYERMREAEAQRLGIKRVSILDKLVTAARGDDDPAHSRSVVLHDAVPWPDPVDGAELLDALASAIRRHVILTASQADALALWICHTWAFDRFDHTPRLAITSPTKRCGKSTLLDVLRATCRRTLKADNVSASGIFRTVEALRPLTLLIDEADSFLRDAEELRGVLNSGFERSGQVIRVVERQGEHQPVMFATFCPVALAAIGELPGTLSDRAVPIVLARKAAAETTVKLRAPGARDVLATLARKLARWAEDNAARLPTDPAIPDALGDREGDISVPLLAVADHAGQAWGERGRRVLLDVVGLRAADDDGAETGSMLLADLRDLFRDHGKAERLSSADIATALGKMESRPWPEWRNGKPITVRQIAVVLRPFGIRPQNLKQPGGDVVKGYIAANFADAWSRYLPQPTPDCDSVRYHRYQTGIAHINGKNNPLPMPLGSGSKTAISPINNNAVAAVADRNGGITADGVAERAWEVDL
jgi:putative DNA primase/helicase